MKITILIFKIEPLRITCPDNLRQRVRVETHLFVNDIEPMITAHRTFQWGPDGVRAETVAACGMCPTGFVAARVLDIDVAAIFGTPE